MAGRPGFLGGSRQGDASDRDAGGGFGGTPFDPVWGTLGPPDAQASDPWRTNSPDAEAEGPAFDIEIFGDGFQISGQIRTGQFGRLSDWLNMQSGFIQVKDGMQVHLGETEVSDPEQKRGTLWVRVDQVVMVAERANIQQTRPGTPVVQKERRKVSIVTPGYSLRGSLHIHAHGSMRQYLETPEPHFLPMTDVTVRWLADPTVVARVPFAMVNRQQLITILDEPSAPADDSGHGAGESETDEAMPLHRRIGAA
ncbi:MAG: hypothetical protein ABSE70_09515 [Candidatus Limnocylindrales bacterium]